MKDPRFEITKMISDIRKQLIEIEMTMWQIPHGEENEDDYEETFVPPIEGEYNHPETPTHEPPEEMGDDCTWNAATQLYESTEDWDDEDWDDDEDDEEWDDDDLIEDDEEESMDEYRTDEDKLD